MAHAIKPETVSSCITKSKKLIRSVCVRLLPKSNIFSVCTDGRNGCQNKAAFLYCHLLPTDYYLACLSPHPAFKKKIITQFSCWQIDILQEIESNRMIGFVGRLNPKLKSSIEKWKFWANNYDLFSYSVISEKNTRQIFVGNWKNIQNLFNHSSLLQSSNFVVFFLRFLPFSIC